MEARNLQDIFIKILRSELNRTPLEDAVRDRLNSDTIAALYRLSKKHDLAHIIACSLRKCGLLAEGEIAEKLEKKELTSVYRTEKIRYTYNQICSVLDETGVAYIPLKGAIIRPYYPAENMRTSCDIDILIREEDLGTAVEALMQKRYKCGERAFHDISLYSPSGIHLELHFSIRENSAALDAILQDVWQYATPSDGCRYDMSREFFLFHMFAHMSYHFLSGGCGMRSLMDVWIMEHKMGIDIADARGLLEKAGIYQFAEEMSELAEICFSGKEPNDLTDLLLSYIVSGGVYGSLENHVAIRGAKSHLTFSYMWNRVFIPYKELKLEYPVLKKCCILLPFCWLARSVKLFARLLRTLFRKKRARGRVSEDKTERLQQMRSRLGL